MSFHYRHRKLIILVIVFLLLTGGMYFYIKNFTKKNERKEVPKKNSITIKKENNITSKKDSSIYYKVDIKGQVNNPGIYSLKADSRVIDVINSSGGVTDNADLTVLNLSKKIKDEMVIIVYSKEEVADFKKTKEIEEQVQKKCIQKDSDSLINDGCITENNSDKANLTGKININTATLEELLKLPGVGETKAKNIINYRNKNGVFKEITDLKKVDGIGESIYAQIEAFITVE